MKKLWKQNRVLVVLIFILLACFVAICSVAITFFYNKDVTEYGDRLENIEDYPIDKALEEKYENSVMEKEHVEKVTLHVKGRIIYINLNFDSEIPLEDAKSVATASLDNFEEKYLKYYDVEFVMKSENFTIIGAKNAVSDLVAWNNNTPVEEEEDDEG